MRGSCRDSGWERRWKREEAGEDILGVARSDQVVNLRPLNMCRRQVSVLNLIKYSRCFPQTFL